MTGIFPSHLAHFFFLTIAVATLMTASANAARRNNAAEIIFVNGEIYVGAVQVTTSNGGIDWKPLPRAQAIAVRDGHVAAVGSDAEVKKLKGKHTQVVDLGGHFVMPGFNDAHAHLAAGGLEYLHIELVGTNSLAEMQQRIAAAAGKTAPGDWIIGRGWDQTLWAGARLPTRQDLDAVTGGHPAVFQRVDGHIAVLNSAGLKAMGITRDTPNPPGGSIDHDASGEPTGIVRESARDDVIARLPKPTIAQRRRGIELALSEAAKWGVTSVQDSISVEEDPTEWENFLVYEELEREGKLTARISQWLPFTENLQLLETHRAHHEPSDPMLHTGLLKLYLDGALGSRTAALLQPYADDPKNSGILREDEGKLKSMAVERTRAGFQLGFHAIGDRAVAQALDVFAEAERDARERAQTPPRGFRFRIEHDQVVEPAQIVRYRALEVIASVQPCHLLTDMNWAEARLGRQRARNSYPWAEFLRNDVLLAFGTDFPVEPLNPFRNLYAAVTRKNEAGTLEYFPEQAVSMDQAIASYTVASAYAEFEERDKGTLELGKLADFVVLDRDIKKVSPAELLKTRVLRTVVGGKSVYESGSQ
jgi:predicted amidohydrolase YtcJ